MKIYIAGKITGLPKAEYTAKFLQAELAQKGRGTRRIEAGDQIGGLDLGFHDASGPT